MGVVSDASPVAAREGPSRMMFYIPYRQDLRHLLNLCRYVHINPVKERLVADPADRPWSN